MNPETDYTKRELELLFKRLEEKIDGLRDDIKSSNQYFLDRLVEVEEMVKSHDRLLNKWQTILSIAMAVWGVIMTAVWFVLNKFL